jgi:hypothetical protein
MSAASCVMCGSQCVWIHDRYGTEGRHLDINKYVCVIFITFYVVLIHYIMSSHVFEGLMLCHWMNGARDFFLHCLTPNVEALQPFQTPGTSRPVTQRHIPEDLNLQ